MQQRHCQVQPHPVSYVFSNRVADRRNQLPEKCIKCSTVNTFKKHISIELEPELQYVMQYAVLGVS